MIKIFRRIRQKLLREYKISKYLIYAIGEIILVVFGILIALQINNWNEWRKENDVEQDYLIALKQEIEYNLSGLEQVMNVSDSTILYGTLLHGVAGTGEPLITEEQFGIYALKISSSQFDPSNGVINDIISSGKLSIIKNDTIRAFVSTWEGSLKRIQTRENELDDYIKKLENLIYNYGNTHKAAYYSRGKRIPPSSFEKSNLELLEIVQFESSLSGINGICRGLKNGLYGVTKSRLNEIKAIVEREIDL